jgi:glutamyl-tRNA(Gln) amidotransferase subunit D
MQRVKLKWKGTELHGILVNEEKGHKTIKLDSGYNIGVSDKEIEKMELGEAVDVELGEKKGGDDGDVAILGCGGTIASEVDYNTGAVFPRMTPAFLKASFPELNNISSIKSSMVFNIFSEDMNAWHWAKMAESAYEELKDGKKGVVLMHGTDTMHYSAAALAFALEGLNAPVVFVGAQRSSDRPSSDNKLNLLNAVFSATQNIAEVGICMHATVDDSFCHYHRGVKARKMHTSRRDAFKSIGMPPLAKVDYRDGTFEELHPYRKRSGGRPKLRNKFSDNVALVYVYPGIKKGIIAGLGKCDGVVLAGTGLGHIPTNPGKDRHATPILKEAKALVDSGIPVVVTSQTIYGRVNHDVYSAGRLIQEAGLMGNGLDMTPETAYVKLCWTLGQEKDAKKVRKIMETNVAGEITERSALSD